MTLEPFSEETYISVDDKLSVLVDRADVSPIKLSVPEIGTSLVASEEREADAESEVGVKPVLPDDPVLEYSSVPKVVVGPLEDKSLCELWELSEEVSSKAHHVV